jgi:hypothetical protein
MKAALAKLFFFTLLLFNLWACGGKPSSVESTYFNSNIPSDSIPHWHFNTLEDTLGNPQTQIFLVARDSVKIAYATAPFSVIEKQEYQDKKLPQNTLTACSGFWAGLDQAYIVVDSSDFWLVKAKFEDEGSEEPESFETIKVIKK